MAAEKKRSAGVCVGGELGLEVIRLQVVRLNYLSG
jgi:hypothetical protein